MAVYYDVPEGNCMSNFKVFKYGLLSPIENADLVDEQMYLAHKYRNTLNEIECGRRDAVRSLTRENSENIQRLEAALLVAEDIERKSAFEIKSQHSIMRSRVSTQTDKEELKFAREKRKECKRLLNETRHLLKPSKEEKERFTKMTDEELVSLSKSDPTLKLKIELELINKLAKKLIHSAREFCGVYWGTYLLAEEAVSASVKMPLYDGLRDNNPKFVPWKQEGSISVQLQGGLDAKDIFGDSSTQIHIDAVNDNAFYADKRSDRKKAQKTVLHIRVQSDKAKPIWASFPMLMHRPLPDGSSIKLVKVHRKRIANRNVWSVDITIDTSKCLTPTFTSEGAIGIDLGWRVMRNENGEVSDFRIGKWRDDNGDVGEIKLPIEIVNGIRKASELKSVRDDNFNLVRTELVSWLKTNETILPEWLKSYHKIGSLPQWRSIDKLVRLVYYWGKNRFDGDEEIYGISGAWNKSDKILNRGSGLAGWRYHDDHLWNWECSQRKKAIKRRREFYRVESTKLANKYKALILEDFDLRGVSQKAEPDDKDDNQKGRANRTLCAPDEFRQSIINAFATRGGSVIKIDPKNTSRICFLCVSAEHLNHETHIHTCSSCGETWDRDDNAAKHIVALGLLALREQLSAAQTPESARKEENINDSIEVVETRYQRRNRAKLGKETRMQAAREAEDKIA